MLNNTLFVKISTKGQRKKRSGDNGSFPTENLVPFDMVTAIQQLGPPFQYNP
jgi:hypothetical protein